MWPSVSFAREIAGGNYFHVFPVPTSFLVVVSRSSDVITLGRSPSLHGVSDPYTPSVPSKPILAFRASARTAPSSVVPRNSSS